MTIKQGSTVRYRKPGMTTVHVGRVEHVFVDAFTHEPYYRVRPDTLRGRRTEVRLSDIERAEKPIRQPGVRHAK